MNLQNDAVPLLLNMQMVADSLNALYWDFTLQTVDSVPRLRNCLMFTGQSDLQPDILYILPSGMGDSFPRDTYCYVTLDNLTGQAPHIRNLQQPLLQIINELIGVFQHYRDFEVRLSKILNADGSLNDLCVAASDFFRNPVYIHDEFFSVIGISSLVKGMLEFEYNENTDKLYIPLWLIDDFKFDEAYLNTMTLHQSGIWDTDQYPHNIRSLFMNLWDGDRYLGRVLINELSSSLQPGQFQMIEYFARYVVMLLCRNSGSSAVPHAFENTLKKLMEDKAVEQRELHTMLSILGWKEEDHYLCLVLQGQKEDASIRSDSALMGKLTFITRSFTSFFLERRLYIVINMTKGNLEPGFIRQSLAPFIRDSYMYGGISNPVLCIKEIGIGFRQADITLKYISQQDNRQWLLPFSACALPYILQCSAKELPPKSLCAPGLLQLKKFDEENATRYYETLKAYLLHERNIPQTAEALIIHRTTLTYRLSKINELLKLNLEDPEIRTYCILSFYLLDQ